MHGPSSTDFPKTSNDTEGYSGLQQFNNFKNGIEKEFAFLKEATSKNVGNF